MPELQVIDIVDGNQFDAFHEAATGTDGVIIKAGQGRLEYVWKPYAAQAARAQLPWGVYWLCDARYSPESHKAAIKAAFPTGDFGKLGLWLDVEKPVRWWPDWLYRLQPYAYYKPIESIWRGMYAAYGINAGWYFSAGSWDLILSAMPISLQQEIAAKSRLWIANYGAVVPKMRGAWPKWDMWQYREGPDYSIVDPDFWTAIMGPHEPPPPVETLALDLTVRSERAELENAILTNQDKTINITNATAFHVKPFTTVPPPPPPPPPPAGALYDLKIRGTEYTDIPAPARVGSFAQLGGRGQDNWILLEKPEIEFIKKWVHNAELWNWAASTRGDIYTARDDQAYTVRWPIVLMSSGPGRARQFVRLAPETLIESGKAWRKFIGIPWQANGDYSQFTPDKYPEFFLWCPTIYPDNRVGWDSHNDMIFLMPLFQPGTGFQQSRSADEYNGFVDAGIFLGPHI